MKEIFVRAFRYNKGAVITITVSLAVALAFLAIMWISTLSMGSAIPFFVLPVNIFFTVGIPVYYFFLYRAIA